MANATEKPAVENPGVKDEEWHLRWSDFSAESARRILSVLHMGNSISCCARAGDAAHCQDLRTTPWDGCVRATGTQVRAVQHSTPSTTLTSSPEGPRQSQITQRNQAPPASFDYEHDAEDGHRLGYRASRRPSEQHKRENQRVSKATEEKAYPLGASRSHRRWSSHAVGGCPTQDIVVCSDRPCRNLPCHSKLEGCNDPSKKLLRAAKKLPALRPSAWLVSLKRKRTEL